LARERVQRARPSVWIARAILRRRISWRRGRSGRRSTRGRGGLLLLPGLAEAEGAVARPCGGACSGKGYGYRNLVSACSECNSQKGERLAGNYLRWLCGERRLSPDELSGRFAALEKRGPGSSKKSAGVASLRGQGTPAYPARLRSERARNSSRKSAGCEPGSGGLAFLKLFTVLCCRGKAWFALAQQPRFANSFLLLYFSSSPRRNS
jgi:hypothetical protein